MIQRAQKCLAPIYPAPYDLHRPARQPLFLVPRRHLAAAGDHRRHRPVGAGHRAAVRAGEFGIDRSGASLPYTATMIGFALGGVMMGRLADRFGIMVPMLIGTVILGARLFRRRHGAELLDVRCRAGAAHRLPRLRDHLRAAGGRRVAVVPAAARHRRRHRGERQLSRRNDLAADPHLGHRRIGLAQRLLALGVMVLVTMLPLSFLLRRRASLDDVPSAAHTASRPHAHRHAGRCRRC